MRTKACSFAVAVTALSMAGCQAPVAHLPQAPPAANGAGSEAGAFVVPPIVGSVVMSEGYRTQSTIGDVAVAATISLIKPGTPAGPGGNPPAVPDTTVAATVTDSSGHFSLSVQGFTPTPGTVYILEAFKGLSSNATGANAARVRTLVSFQGGAWTSVSKGAIKISLGTTAVAAAAQLNNLQPSDLALLIGKLSVGTKDASGSDDSLDPVAGISQADFDLAFQNASGSLTNDRDPLAMLAKANNAVYNKSPGGSGIGIAPGTGYPGDIVTISSAKWTFDPVAHNNTVYFPNSPYGPPAGQDVPPGGMLAGDYSAANIVSVSSDNHALTVRIPDGADEGPVVVLAPGQRGVFNDFKVGTYVSIDFFGVPIDAASISVSLNPPGGVPAMLQTIMAHPNCGGPPCPPLVTFKNLTATAGWTVSAQALNGNGNAEGPSSTTIEGPLDPSTLRILPAPSPYGLSNGANYWTMDFNGTPIVGVGSN